MKRAKETPRPIAPGDVVAAYSDELGEWAACQVTHLDPAGRTAGVLDLDWSGPEPHSVGDLGGLVPLRETHHAFTGQLSHCNYEWLLPRSYQVIGNVAPLVDRASNAYSAGWRIGDRLSRQRRWDRGDRSAGHPGERTFSGAEIADLAFPDLWSVSITDVGSLDCDDVATIFPNLTRLSLTGNLGSLSNAAGLNRLTKLKTLFVGDLFGMSAADCLSTRQVPNLEMLGLHSVPAEYAAAMKKAWTPEVANGTFVEITSPRKPGWVAENRDNPLREWDGRPYISGARYRKTLAQYKATRRAVFEMVAQQGSAFDAAGRQFGEAFNGLDFLDTEEREELFAALDAIVDEAEVQFGRTLDGPRRELMAGVDSVRDW